MDGTTYVFTLRIVGDASATIREDDAELWEEIERDRGQQDDDDGAVLRWLGGIVDEAEDQLTSVLPVGWYAKIEDGKVSSDD